MTIRPNYGRPRDIDSTSAAIVSDWEIEKAGRDCFVIDDDSACIANVVQTA